MVLSSLLQPQISIVIPAYNAMRYLPETITTVLEQTYQNFEIVLVNDGSSDSIQNWHKTQGDSRIRLISQENRGLSEARNTGIHHARGEWIAFLDADDLWMPSKLERQVAVMEQYPEVGLVYCGVAIINAASQKTGRTMQTHASGFVWADLMLHNFVECGSTPLVRRDCFVSQGGFDPHLGSHAEDWDMWLRLALHWRFYGIPEPLVCYRQHEGGASKNWLQMERSFVIVLQKAMDEALALQAMLPSGSPRLPTTSLLSVKRRAYANAYLCLAWKPLQARDKKIQEAIALGYKAFCYHPSTLFSKEFLRWGVAIALMGLLGSRTYLRLLKSLHKLRARLRHRDIEPLPQSESAPQLPFLASRPSPQNSIKRR